MKVLSAAEIDAALDDLALIDRLDGLFRAGCEMPVRHHHPIREPLGPGSADAMLLLMPAWTSGASGRVGVKVVTVFPDNGKRSLPSIYGQYLLLDGSTGSVYAGNLPGRVGDLEHTRCHACRAMLVERYGYFIQEYRLTPDGTCPDCGAGIPGRWSGGFEGQISASPFLPGRRLRVI